MPQRRQWCAQQAPIPAASAPASLLTTPRVLTRHEGQKVMVTPARPLSDRTHVLAMEKHVTSPKFAGFTDRRSQTATESARTAGGLLERPKHHNQLVGHRLEPRQLFGPRSCPAAATSCASPSDAKAVETHATAHEGTTPPPSSPAYTRAPPPPPTGCRYASGIVPAPPGSVPKAAELHVEHGEPTLQHENTAVGAPLPPDAVLHVAPPPSEAPTSVSSPEPTPTGGTSLGASDEDSDEDAAIQDSISNAPASEGY